MSGDRVGATSDGLLTRVTDQKLKVRDLFTDALGRLVKVVEAPGAENFATQYRYDVQDLLTLVCQG